MFDFSHFFCNHPVLTKVINLAKKMTYEKQTRNSKNRVRTTWNLINREVRKKVMKENIQTLNTNLNNIVEVCNKYFSEVADTIHKQIKENYKNVKTKSTNCMTYMSMAFGNTFPNIQIKKTTSSEMEMIIGSLKSSKTQGYDETSNNIFKACKIFINVPLSYLCNLALFEGIFPERLKYATIVPVYKKGDNNIVTNYRPISFLTSFNKIFEKVMYCRLLKHLSDNNILSNHQFGFRVNQGTENAIFKQISGILNSLNKKMLFVGYFVTWKRRFTVLVMKYY
jgi:hypothetical protein